MSGQDALSPLIQSLPKVYAQDDPELIQIIKQKYLIPPSDGDYNIHAEQDTSMGQAQTVRKILNNKVSIFNKGCLLRFTHMWCQIPSCSSLGSWQLSQLRQRLGNYISDL